MSSKEKYCQKILKTYGLIVDFQGEPHLKNVPSPVQGETFSKWQQRVLGPDVTDVVFFTPETPSPNKRIETLQSVASAAHLEKTFSLLRKEKTTAVKEAAALTTQVVAKRYENFPKETLRDLVEKHSDGLEPSVLDFFNRLLKSESLEIDTEEIIMELMFKFNNAVVKSKS